jgi:hypothetical protein
MTTKYPLRSASVKTGATPTEGGGVEMTVGVVVTAAVGGAIVA